MPRRKGNTCEEAGCTERGLTVYFSPNEVAGHFCARHCHQNGFCPGCLYFCAGQTGFDFSQNGLCGECASAFEDDCGELEYDEDDTCYWGPDPL